jgi:ketosteroid isomerase-like protein
MKTALLLFAAALVAPAGAIEDMIKLNIDKFASAAKAGDAATLSTLLADDLIYIHSSAKSESKAEAVAALVKSKPTYNHKEPKIRVYGNTAVVNVDISVPATNTNITVLQVWVKNGKNWQMARRHATRLP